MGFDRYTTTVSAVMMAGGNGGSEGGGAGAMKDRTSAAPAGPAAMESAAIDSAAMNAGPVAAHGPSAAQESANRRTAETNGHSESAGAGDAEARVAHPGRTNPGGAVAAAAPELAPTAADQLAETAVLLWPDTTSVQFTSRGADAKVDGGDVVLRQFAYAPSADQAEFLVPVTPSSVTTAALANRRAGLRGLGRGRKAPPDRLHLVGAGRGASIEEFLGELLGTDVAVTIGFQPLITGQQAVLKAYAGSGQPVATVKIGDGQISTAYVEREARALRRMIEVQAARPWRTMRTPAVLHHGDWADLRLLVLSDEEPVKGARPAAEPPIEAMAELSATFSAGRQTLVGSVFWRRLAATGGQLRSPAAARDLNAAMARISGAYGGSALTLGCWHGNWTPRTMTTDRDGAVVLSGWEWFDEPVPAGFDRLHFLVHAAIEGTDGADTFTAEKILTALDAATAGKRSIGEPPGYLLGGLYLVELTCRYQLASAHAVDPALAERADLLLRLLSSYSARFS